MIESQESVAGVLLRELRRTPEISKSSVGGYASVLTEVRRSGRSGDPWARVGNGAPLGGASEGNGERNDRGQGQLQIQESTARTEQRRDKDE